MNKANGVIDKLEYHCGSGL